MNTPPTCNALLPPIHCDAPFGHDGEHRTTKIPPVLAPAVADIVRMSDETETERADVRTMRKTLAERIKSAERLRGAFIAGIAVELALGVVAVVWIMERITA